MKFALPSHQRDRLRNQSNRAGGAAPPKARPPPTVREQPSIPRHRVSPTSRTSHQLPGLWPAYRPERLMSLPNMVRDDTAVLVYQRATTVRPHLARIEPPRARLAARVWFRGVDRTGGVAPRPTAQGITPNRYAFAEGHSDPVAQGPFTRSRAGVRCCGWSATQPRSNCDLQRDCRERAGLPRRHVSAERSAKMEAQRRRERIPTGLESAAGWASLEGRISGF